MQPLRRPEPLIQLPVLSTSSPESSSTKWRLLVAAVVFALAAVALTAYLRGAEGRSFN